MAKLPEKEIEDIYNAGFEAGVAYTFGHIKQDALNRRELIRFVNWIELKCPWKSFDEWYDLIAKHYIRMTEKDYEECKRQYADSRLSYSDQPHMVLYFDKAEKKLDEQWARIKEAGTHKKYGVTEGE